MLWINPSTVSGGQQSRVAVARALHHGGTALLADEPCAALDPERARVAVQALGERFETLICSMYDVTAGLHLTTRVVGIARGRMVFDLPPGDVTPALLEQPYGHQVPASIVALACQRWAITRAQRCPTAPMPTPEPICWP